MVETEERFAEEVMLELGLEGKGIFVFDFSLPDAVLGVEWV